VTPSLKLSKTSGSPGTTLTISGSGYGANETVTIKWNCASSTCSSSTVLGTVTTNSTGQFSGLSITIPSTATAGSYPIGGKGGTSGAFTDVSFTVT
jgi:hypothetical protein